VLYIFDFQQPAVRYLRISVKYFFQLDNKSISFVKAIKIIAIFKRCYTVNHKKTLEHLLLIDIDYL